MPEPEMTADAFSQALDDLGLTDDRAAGAALASDERTIRRWRTGERGIPGPAAVLVRLWTTIHKSRTLIPVQREKLLPARPEPKAAARG